MVRDFLSQPSETQAPSFFPGVCTVTKKAYVLVLEEVGVSTFIIHPFIWKAC